MFSNRVVFWMLLFLFSGIALSLGPGCGVSLDCKEDRECSAPTPLCVAGACRECRKNSDCETGETCEKKTATCKENGTTPTGDCNAGQRRSCFGADLGFIGKGLCRAGQQICTSRKTWGACIGEVKPSKETCDGKDNDCDGQTDEGCKCKVGARQSCGVTRGECRAGTQTCTAGAQWGPCVGERTPKQETCDGKDNDCNGRVDDNVAPRECYTGKAGTAGRGVCKKGQQICSRGRWNACTGQVIPTVEKCDKLDNDCDGQIDETCSCKPGATQACGNGTGECKQGKQTCGSNGKWGACTGQVGPTAEICDRKDNDCDGQVDENPINPAPCAKQLGVCKASKARRCIGGRWSGCDTNDYQKHNPKYQTNETTCDGLDNDCDGKVDENSMGCVSTFSGSGASCPSDSRKRKYNACHKDGSATTATFVYPHGIVLDASGNLYVVDVRNHRIRKVDKNGSVTTYAGDGRCEYNPITRKYTNCYRDGSRLSAQFFSPEGIAIDKSGNLYISDAGNHRIRRITPSGQVSTYAGTGVSGLKDGPKGVGQLSSPSGLVLDSNGNIYVADRGNHAIRKIDKNGTLTTIAGIRSGGNVDGVGSKARFHSPYGLAFGPDGHLYVADTANHLIRKVELNGKVTTFAGSGAPKVQDGKGTQASFYRPASVFWSVDGKLYVGTLSSYRIRVVDTTGMVSTLIGSSSGYLDGPAKTARLTRAYGLTMTNTGTLYFTDSDNRRIRRASFGSSCSSVGSKRSCYTGPGSTQGKAGCKNGTQTCTSSGWTLCTGQTLPREEDCNGKDDDCDGQVDNNLIQGPPCDRSSGACQKARKTRCSGGKWQPCTVTDYKKVSPTFQLVEKCDGKDDNCDGRVDENAPNCVSTAGGRRYSYNFKDGFATEALFNRSAGIAVDSKGNIFVADTNNYRIRKIDPVGNVTTFSGTGTGGTKDGDAKTAQFTSLKDIAIDKNGFLYVLDNHSVRKIDTSGKVTTIAGGQTGGFRDGMGTTAMFNAPGGLDVDGHGNIFIADTNNHRIRKIDTAGNVSTIAGSGSSTFKDGQGTAASFDYPRDVVVGYRGDLFVADYRSYRIRKIDKSGNVTTFAGSGRSTSVNGTGTSAGFDAPVSLVSTPSGILYVLDDDQIRRITTSRAVTTLAGSTAGFTDGALSVARFSRPQGIAIDSDGNLYIADTSNTVIRKVTLSAPTTCTQEGGTTGCYTGRSGTKGIGVCKEGKRTCRDGLYSLCEGQVTQTSEDCNGKDDDCDGLTDNNLPPAALCRNQVGVCAGARSPSCTRGQWAACTSTDYQKHSSAYRSTEICDGKDNNCDGQIDEELTDCVKTVAGQPRQGTADGGVFQSQLNNPNGLAIDGKDNVYIADTDNHLIRKLTPKFNLSTVAGSRFGYQDGTGTAARFYGPADVAVDSTGILYVADTRNQRIRKIDSTGKVTTLAGSGTAGLRNGSGTSAQFNYPRSIVVDSSGNLFVADSRNHCIRKITRSGFVSVFAGSTTGAQGNNDGTGTSARFREPYGLAIDSNNNLYVADSQNHTIRKITSAGVVTTLAGSGAAGFKNDQGTKARFYYPRGIAVDKAGVVYVADSYNHRIRKIDSSGTVTTFAGKGSSTHKDAPLVDALFNYPYDIVLDSLGNFYVADRSNHRIRKIVVKLPQNCTTNGQTRTCYTGPSGTKSNTPCKEGSQTCSGGLWSTCSGEILPKAEVCNGKDDNCDGQVDNNLGQGPVCKLQEGPCQGSFQKSCVQGQWQACSTSDYQQHSNTYSTTETCDGIDNDCNGLVDDSAAQCVTTIAGNGSSGYKDDKGTAAQFRSPSGVAVDSGGLLVVTDTLNHRIRKISKTSVVTTFVGSGTQGSTDGTGTAASLNTPWGIVSDGKGGWFFCDQTNHLIRKIDSTGKVTTFAGSGNNGFKDGTGTAAQFNAPTDLVLDSSGNIYVADANNHAIRKITPAGVVTTLAGNGNDGKRDGKGSLARFDTPGGIAIDSSGNLYVSDSKNGEVRKVTPSGDVSTFSNLSSIYRLRTPAGIAVDSQGKVYVAESAAHRIRILSSSGRSDGVVGMLTFGRPGYKDGSFSNSRFDTPVGLRLVNDKQLYVTDRGNHRIRLIVIK